MHNPLSLAFFLFLCFPYTATTRINAHTHLSINCGGATLTRNGREWIADANPNLSSQLQIKGSSTASPAAIPVTLDQVPYGTARISNSRFSFEFRVNPGEKLIRLHFNSVPYKGFKSKRFKDFFDVRSGPFTLLSNFSVSLAADALGVSSFVKEFCVKVEEHHLLNLTFSAATSPLFDTYAFINGIEIISVPSSHSYFHVENDGLQMVGKSLVSVGHRIVFEIVSRLNVRKELVSPLVNGFGSSFLMWDSDSVPRERKINNDEWKVSVDVGFRYLFRIYFSRIQFARLNVGDFKVHINEMVACTNTDIVGESNGEDEHVALYRDFMVMMDGCKQEGKRDIVLYLETSDDFMDVPARGLVEGFEIMKLSNPDNNLASPNPQPAAKDLSYQTTKNLVQVLGRQNMAAFFVIMVLLLLNIVIWILRKPQEAGPVGKGNFPLARDERLCRMFSLAEIKEATKDFNYGLLIGRGGFGKVYKGLIDNGQQTVAIKRLKFNSGQGAHEFWSEIDTLTWLRHVNLVSLIGYCNECGEMILVYEYMPGGTLADYLFKLVWDSGTNSPLTWKQRLKICIGAGRGLDYLHTGASLIHRDVKASNILLDEDFVPKVSDFGLAKCLCRKDLQSSHVSTKVKGTHGYLDPDYISSKRLSAKSDVYSFGVVLLEVLCGRRVLDAGVLMEDEYNLTHWAQECIRQGKVEQIVAYDLRGEISAGSLKAFVEVAESCLDIVPRKRPTMAKVVLQLEFALEQLESSNFSVPKRVTSLVDDSLPKNNDVQTSVDLDKVTAHSTGAQKTYLAMKGQNGHREVNSVPSLRRKGWWKDTVSKQLQTWRWSAVFGKRQRNEFSTSSQPSEFGTGSQPNELNNSSNFIKKVRKTGYLKGMHFRVIERFGAGEFYQAVSNDTGEEFTMKQLIKSPEEFETPERIKCELMIVGQIRHRNILAIRGLVQQPDCICMVFDYMKNASLQDCLVHVADGSTELDWLARYKIALGVTHGLEHLHMNHTFPIHHRNLKPSNILLDEEMEPRISGFGLAKIAAQYYYSSGNLAPECSQTSTFSVQCDVYSLGVVLAVLVIGKLPCDEFFQHTCEMDLVKWMRNIMNSEDQRRAIDPKLLGNGYEEQMLLVLKVACFCTVEDPEERATSREARFMLSQIKH